MTDNTQPEALRLANEFKLCNEYDSIPSINDIAKAEAELRRQHARIAELEADHFEDKLDMVARWYMVDKDGMATLCTDREDAEQEAKYANMAWPHTAPHRAVQLVEASTAGFTAADMATASAQGFRNGAASVAASAGSEPVATVFTMEALAPGGGVKYHATVHKPLPAGTKLYIHPSPPEGMVGWWQDIATAPRDGSEVLANTAGLGRIVVYWDDDESQWGTGLGYLHRDAPTHWIPLPPLPTTSADSRTGE